jgi:hypothetical protein
MPITLNRKRKGAHPLEILHTSLESTLCTQSVLKSHWSADNVPSSDPEGSKTKQNRLIPYECIEFVHRISRICM